MSSGLARDRKAANFQAYEAMVGFTFCLIAEYVGRKATSPTCASLHDINAIELQRSVEFQGRMQEFGGDCHWNFGPEKFGPGRKFSLKILVRPDR